MSRTRLHVVTDWPGHFPRGATSVAVLVEAGADVNARFRGPHGETPLHWAASSDDVAVLDALLDAGADIDVPGAVIAGGTPLADAIAFAQWKVAHRLVERGAQVNLFAAASLGLMDRLDALVSGAPPGHRGSAQRCLLGGLSRWPVACCRISPEPRGHPELATGLGAVDPARRSRPERRNRCDHLAGRPRRQDGPRCGRRLTTGGCLVVQRSICGTAAGSILASGSTGQAMPQAGTAFVISRLVIDKRPGAARGMSPPEQALLGHRRDGLSGAGRAQMARRIAGGALVARWWRGRSALLGREDANGARVRQV